MIKNYIMKKIFVFLFITFIVISCKQSKISKDSSSSPSNKYVKHFRPSDGTRIERIAFGSCSNQRLNQEYWKVIASKNPDLWIWMGDVIYSDTEDMADHKKEFDLMKFNPFYQDFIGQVPVIGTWDDHDYGVNDGDRFYPKRDESKELFMDFLDIPDSAKVRTHKGVYDVFEFGKGLKKIKVFLLDNRYFKDKLELDSQTARRYKPDMSGTVLGEEQWEWLEKEITNSDAMVNLFVSGLQIIPDDHIYEKWGDFPKERKKFLDLLEKTKVKNPIIFSGDRHFAELSEYTYMDFSANVLELTTSGLTHSYEGVEEVNAYRLGQVYDGKNFGVFEVTWGGTKILIKLYIYDINGKEIFQHGIITDY
jgi:alkaline phosphatase D